MSWVDETMARKFAYPFLQLGEILHVARGLLSTVLDKVAESPEPHRWLAVLLCHIQSGMIRPAAHFSSFGDDCIDTLREGVVQHGQSGLDA